MLISGKESNIEPSELRKHTVYVINIYKQPINTHIEPSELRKHTVYVSRLRLIHLLEYYVLRTTVD